jgi:selenocysteine lyase/cysteine desulfurase
VRWVTRSQHRFSYDVEVREEGGTPNILGILRAAVPLQIQASLGLDETHTISANYALRAINTWRLCPAIHLTGGDRPAYYRSDRMPIVALNMTVRKPDGSAHRGAGGHQSEELMLHPHFVATVLNDVYGIQARRPCQQHCAA